MNVPQIVGVTESTIVAIAPVVMQALAATNPAFAAALPAIEAAFVAFGQLKASGVFTDDQVAAAATTVAQAVVAAHTAPKAAA